jgi:nucleoid DNA-binding protein
MRKMHRWAAAGVLAALVAGLAFAAPMTTADKPAAADKDKPAATDKDKPVPTDKDKPASTDKDKPAPTDKDKPAATDKDKPAPADKDKGPVIIQEQPANKEKDKDKAAKEKEKPATLKERIATETKLAEADVAKMLDALGPAVRDQLARGERVELPGLGVLRVVHVPQHRDLIGGRPALVAGNNYVDFLPDAGLVQAANAPGAVPQATVPPFQYNPLPGQTPSQHVPDERMPNVRVR